MAGYNGEQLSFWNEAAALEKLKELKIKAAEERAAERKKTSLIYGKKRKNKNK